MGVTKWEIRLTQLSTKLKLSLAIILVIKMKYALLPHLVTTIIF